VIFCSKSTKQKKIEKIMASSQKEQYQDLVVALGDLAGKTTLIGQLLNEYDEKHRAAIAEFRKTRNETVTFGPCGSESIVRNEHNRTTEYREYLHKDSKIKQQSLTTTVPTCYHLRKVPLLISSSSSSSPSVADPSSPSSSSPPPTFSFDIFDTPGDRDFTGSIFKTIAGASIAIIVVSAAQNEFEASIAAASGLVRTAFLAAYSFGVKRFIFAINKLDKVQYSHDRFLEVKDELQKVLKRMIPAGPFLTKNVSFVPISANEGVNLFPQSGKEGGGGPKKDELMPWNQGHPTLMEVLQQASIDNFLLNTAPVRFGDVLIPSARLTEEQKKAAADKMLTPLEQKTVPLRAMVFQKLNNVQRTNRNRGYLLNQPRSKYLDDISEIVYVKVISGVLKLGDMLVVEPGSIVRKVVSIGFDDETESIRFLDEFETEENHQQKQQLPFVEGPAGLASLGLAQVSDAEVNRLKQERQRNDEIEFLNFQQNPEEAQAAVDALLQKTAPPPRYNKNGNRSVKHLLGAKPKNNNFNNNNNNNNDDTNQDETTTIDPWTIPPRFKKQNDVVNSVHYPFAFRIKRGSVIGHFLQPDAPRVYFADKDFASCQLLVMWIGGYHGLMRQGFSPAIDCGTQHCPCRIEILHKVDKVTGKPLIDPTINENDTEQQREKKAREFLNLKAGDGAKIRLTPVYPHLPLIIDPLFFEGRGSNSRTVLGRIVMRNGARIVGACAVRSLWMYRKWPFLIRYFGRGPSSEAFQVWNILVNVSLFLSWAA
jgi:translation elongation factor EF-1alpha